MAKLAAKETATYKCTGRILRRAYKSDRICVKFLIKLVHSFTASGEIDDQCTLYSIPLHVLDYFLYIMSAVLAQVWAKLSPQHRQILRPKYMNSYACKCPQ